MISAITLACLLFITGCADTVPVFETSSEQVIGETTGPQTPSIIPNTQPDSEENNPMVSLSVNNTPVPVLWEENKSVEELFSLLENGAIIVNTERYGGFEQVGSLPQGITSDDMQMTTTTGDIVLYNGSSIVLFYGSNSWAYTKLGRIDGMSAEEIKKLFDVEEMEITISLIQ
jgi:hypothetical protein